MERLGDGAPPRVNDDGSNGTMSCFKQACTRSCEVKEMVYARGIEQWLTEAAVIDDDGGGDSRSAPVKKRCVLRVLHISGWGS